MKERRDALFFCWNVILEEILKKRIDIKGEMDIINNNSNHYYLRGAL